MTPTDALIEKMARAIWKLSPYRRSDETWETSPVEFRWRRLQEARAAYEAEHEEEPAHDHG